MLVLSVVITPELVCTDRRDRTLSLYFSTAIGSLDYVLGKIAAALMPLLLVTLAPVLLLYVGTVLFSVHPVGYLQAHWLDLPRIIASSLIVATFYGLVGLAISSLTSRTPCARHQSVSSRSCPASTMVPVGLAGEASTSPASGAAVCAASSIATVGWKRSAGPQSSSTTPSGWSRCRTRPTRWR